MNAQMSALWFTKKKTLDACLLISEIYSNFKIQFPKNVKSVTTFVFPPVLFIVKLNKKQLNNRINNNNNKNPKRQRITHIDLIFFSERVICERTDTSGTDAKPFWFFSNGHDFLSGKENTATSVFYSSWISAYTQNNIYVFNFAEHNMFNFNFGLMPLMVAIAITLCKKEIQT